jgi:hypothetical protein
MSVYICLPITVYYILRSTTVLHHRYYLLVVHSVMCGTASLEVALTLLKKRAAKSACARTPVVQDGTQNSHSISSGCYGVRNE